MVGGDDGLFQQFPRKAGFLAAQRRVVNAVRARVDEAVAQIGQRFGDGHKRPFHGFRVLAQVAGDPVVRIGKVPGRVRGVVGGDERAVDGRPQRHVGRNRPADGAELPDVIGVVRPLERDGADLPPVFGAAYFLFQAIHVLVHDLEHVRVRRFVKVEVRADGSLPERVLFVKVMPEAAGHPVGCLSGDGGGDTFPFIHGKRPFCCRRLAETAKPCL